MKSSRQRKIEFKIHSFSRWIMACSCLFLLNDLSLYGKDFGIRGELFAISEENVISLLQRRISQKSSIETIDSHISQLQENAKHPKSPIILPEASTYNIHYFDPTFVTKESITDKNGAILFAKGTKVNPLKNLKLSSGLLFFDGTKSSHLHWARSQDSSFKWILVNGDPFKLEEQEKRPVYFDQQGFSISKFHIQQIPARITQEGVRLKIEEIPLEEKVGPL